MGSLNGDMFIDILEERRKTSDIRWATKTWDVSPCKFSLKRTPQEIKDSVLNSEKIDAVIKEISKENNWSEEETKLKAKEILDEMSHNFQFKVIRFFGYVLSKFMKSVYGKILVNKKGVEKIGSVSSQYPVLFLPTHRSYSDFLLVSYVCFYFNLPVPVIAAGLDFLGLKYLNFLLRGAGAFFIRRSFVGDKLYKEIFTEYVQTHIEGCEYPMEFFIEGTRSRTAKSLVPKLGMLQSIIELFFASKVPDIIVVPISISYDRTLEETLYAYELLGVPKPKESTRGLIKARKVMSDFFGNVYVRFGEQISLKDYFRNYDRSVHNLHPRNFHLCTKEEQVLCRDLANHVIRMHQCNLLLSPFPLVCLVISQPEVTKTKGLHFNSLVDSIYWLEELVRRTGATIYSDQNDVSESLTEQLKLHSNIIQISDDGYVSLKQDYIQYPVSVPNVPCLQSTTVKYAIPALFAYHYGNQVLQLLVHVSMVCLAMGFDEENLFFTDDIFFRYKTLRILLQREFVFERLTSEQDFMHALQSLKEENIICVEGNKIYLVNSCLEKSEFLSSILLPFLESYCVVCHYLIQKDYSLGDCKKVSLECQLEIENTILSGILSDYRCLSLDIVNNCITFLVNEGALTKVSNNGQYCLLPNKSKLSNVVLDLELFLPTLAKLNNPSLKFSMPTAKL
ncbi:dihydroxyacetone phosphate acyltransferase-like [Uloborus diversus]|uniref:dihydroxyacetone phosphate acyltransferase-like n=1 Tax=Uloborus diversus TaxID=327109 RepID=UPI00240A1D65|nr:dihydroxyacetone phosphate acyltransferase-like [Uloborus diversus]